VFSSELVINLSQRSLPTQQTQEPNVHVVGGIRVRFFFILAAAHFCLDRTTTGIGFQIFRPVIYLQVKVHLVATVPGKNILCISL